MAIAVDASTPIRWAGLAAVGGTIVSASFTAPANSLIVVTVEADGIGTDANTATVTDSGGLTWTERVRRDWSETTDGGMSGIYTAPQVSSAARTITVTRGATTGKPDRQFSAKAYVLTGVDLSGTPVDTVSASNEGGSATNNLTTTSVTPGANGLLVVAGTDWNELGNPTSSDLTVDATTYAGAISVISGYKTSTSGVGVTGNLDAFGAAAAQWKWCQVTVRQAPAAAALLGPPYPERFADINRPVALGAV